ncbi:uncharacterized protein LOC133901312 [Phragmites australis]|uniref:uncharacterized protein LOC133901312 n=1 Tax=Phragmites australis TaxID=29695 RepID=UPI002D7758CC|nr:uncharacterized protein LOC133901312 [Phragmites australis]
MHYQSFDCLRTFMNHLLPICSKASLLHVDRESASTISLQPSSWLRKFAMASAAALKVATVCMLLLCVGSDLARPALASPPSPDDKEAAAARALMRELVEHEIAEELGLQGAGQHHVGDVCSPACQTCLIVCAVTCVLNPASIACFVNCTVTSACFGKPVAA